MTLRKGHDFENRKLADAPESAASHSEDMLDEALRETFPASDPIAITIDHRAPKGARASKVMRDSIVRGPLIAEAEQGAKAVAAEEHSLSGHFKAMLWGPTQIFNWWSFLIGGKIGQ
jgi:hypothetical protein